MSVRMYKDNLRQPLYRTLLFTDLVIFVLIGVGIAGLTYLLFRSVFAEINWLSYLFLLGILESAFLVIITLPVDNQPIYKILSRGLLFLLGKKQFRGNQLDGYYTDFTIQDDLIIRKKSVSKVFRINPYDISALNGEERATFFANMKQALHVLPAQLQVVVRKERATVSDFTDHFMQVYQSLPKRNEQKETMVANYQQELTAFVERENLQMVKQYGVFAVSVDTNNVSEKVAAIGKLEDMYHRFSSALQTCHITTKKVTNTELASFMRRLLR